MLTTALRIQKPHAMSATQIRKRMMRGAIKRRKSLKKSVFEEPIILNPSTGVFT